jgi:hypothetical protein
LIVAAIVVVALFALHSLGVSIYVLVPGSDKSLPMRMDVFTGKAWQWVGRKWQEVEEPK